MRKIRLWLWEWFGIGSPDPIDMLDDRGYTIYHYVTEVEPYVQEWKKR